MKNSSKNRLINRRQTAKKIMKATATGNENLGNCIPQGVENYDETPRRIYKSVADLVRSNAMNSSFTSIPSNFMKSFTKSQSATLN